MKWVSMAEQSHTSLRSPCARPSVGRSGVKLAAIGILEQWKRVLWNDESRSPSGSPIDGCGFGRCQKNATCPNA